MYPFWDRSPGSLLPHFLTSVLLPVERGTYTTPGAPVGDTDDPRPGRVGARTVEKEGMKVERKGERKEERRTEGERE